MPLGTVAQVIFLSLEPAEDAFHLSVSLQTDSDRIPLVRKLPASFRNFLVPVIKMIDGLDFIDNALQIEKQDRSNM